MRNAPDDVNEYWRFWDEAKKTGKPMPPGTKEAPFEPMKFGLDYLIENDRKRLNKYSTMQEPQPIRPLPKMWMEPDGTVRLASYSDEEVQALAVERVTQAARLRAAETENEPPIEPDPGYMTRCGHCGVLHGGVFAPFVCSDCWGKGLR
jgi:hypothetical protein